MNGFAGTNVFGHRMGQATPIMVQAGGFRVSGSGGYFASPQGLMMREPWQKREEARALGSRKNNLGQTSRTSGVEFEPSASPLCQLLKTALADNSRQIIGPKWKDFFMAMERLRPLDVENPKWRAQVLHQMALHCPDDVSKLRSLPGAPPPSDKCVKLVLRKTPKQIITTIIEPYETRGWKIVQVPFHTPNPQAVKAEQFESQIVREEKFFHPYEVWACPPGDEIPKKTVLSTQEAADLAKSLGQAIGPVRQATPEASSCVKDSQSDLAVTEKLLDRLGTAASGKDEGVDVTQDEIDAANKIIDCASKLGAKVTPPPAAAQAVASGGMSTLTTVGLIGGAGAATAAALFLL